MTGSALDRRAAVATLLQDRADILVISGLGSPSYDLHAAGDHPGNYYLWGAMGSAALVGLGLAQARPDRQVLVITGDGEQLMGLGGLATIGVAKPKNLSVVVLDNEHFGETGMQQSHTARGLDLAGVAAACGIRDARVGRSLADVAQFRDALHGAKEGPRVFIIKVAAANLPRSLPPRDAVHVKNRFRAYLGLETI